MIEATAQTAARLTKMRFSSEIQNGLDQMEGLVSYKTPDHELIHCNQKFLEYTGYTDRRHIIGKNDFNLIWAEYAEVYLKQEQDAMQAKLYSALHPGKDIEGRQFLFLNRKYPWLDEQGKVIGLVCHAQEIKLPSLKEFGLFLKHSLAPETDPLFYIKNKELPFGLSTREMECLFYLARGKTAKQIGKLLSISFRTVEIHLAHLKQKLDCNTKSEVIGAAIEKGLIYVIPPSLLP